MNPGFPRNPALIDLFERLSVDKQVAYPVVYASPQCLSPGKRDHIERPDLLSYSHIYPRSDTDVDIKRIMACHQVSWSSRDTNFRHGFWGRKLGNWLIGPKQLWTQEE